MLSLYQHERRGGVEGCVVTILQRLQNGLGFFSYPCKDKYLFHCEAYALDFIILST
jgi:hypothetical protein